MCLHACVYVCCTKYKDFRVYWNGFGVSSLIFTPHHRPSCLISLVPSFNPLGAGLSCLHGDPQSEGLRTIQGKPPGHQMPLYE